MVFPKRFGFTLIELLVVIAIIAILAVVVVLTLNPAQLLAQSRDANRVSDMATLNTAINLYVTDQGGKVSLGNASSVYLSLPDPSLLGYTTSTCTNLGMPSSAGTYSYYCASPQNFRMASSSGWLPVNFSLISAGVPFGSLPADPVNQSSSNLYYAYETNGSQYVVTSFLESQKYAKTMQTTGGADPALYEVGSGANTLPDLGRGLVGYWPLNEGTANAAVDWSGSANGGLWVGNTSGTNGYYSPGKIWPSAGSFDGATNYVDLGNSATLNPRNAFTFSAWVMFSSLPGVSTEEIITRDDASLGRSFMLRWYAASGWTLQIMAGPTTISYYSPPAINTWYFVAGTGSPSTGFSLYFNGVQVATGAWVAPAATTGHTVIGRDNYVGFMDYWNGEIGDVRMYNRALSAAEVQQLYNVGK